MGADLYFNPPQEDLPTQVSYLVNLVRELRYQNATLREERDLLRNQVRILVGLVKSMPEGSP